MLAWHDADGVTRLQHSPHAYRMHFLFHHYGLIRIRESPLSVAAFPCCFHLAGPDQQKVSRPSRCGSYMCIACTVRRTGAQAHASRKEAGHTKPGWEAGSNLGNSNTHTYRGKRCTKKQSRSCCPSVKPLAACPSWWQPQAVSSRCPVRAALKGHAVVCTPADSCGACVGLPMTSPPAAAAVGMHPGGCLPGSIP